MKSKLNDSGIKHIAIIMDGNGRWAQKRGLPRVAGHERGAAALRRIVKYAGKIGLEYLSVFAFSSENWKRPKAEVDALMNLLVKFCEKESKELKKSNCGISFIGDIESMPERQKKAMRTIEEELSSCTGLKLCIFMNYGGRGDLVNAAKEMCKNTFSDILKSQKSLDLESLETIINQYSEEGFTKYLRTSHVPDPDLLIRTGGEMRISNFMLWQISYSELFFSDAYWPDFGESDLDDAIMEFQKRNRRFGGL